MAPSLLSPAPSRPWAAWNQQKGLALLGCLLLWFTTSRPVHALGLQDVIPASEYQALVDFYHATGDPNWTNNTGWLDPESLDWYGVWVWGWPWDEEGNVAERGHVTGLIIPVNNLDGNLPASLGNLLRLEILRFSHNEKPAIHLLDAKSTVFGGGVILASAHLVKGLEFDEVIVPQADDANYRSEIDRQMLDVACTRAEPARQAPELQLDDGRTLVLDADDPLPADEWPVYAAG